jgi:hypothetical protein
MRLFKRAGDQLAEIRVEEGQELRRLLAGNLQVLFGVGNFVAQVPLGDGTTVADFVGVGPEREPVVILTRQPGHGLVREARTAVERLVHRGERPPEEIDRLVSKDKTPRILAVARRFSLDEMRLASSVGPALELWRVATFSGGLMAVGRASFFEPAGARRGPDLQALKRELIGAVKGVVPDWWTGRKDKYHTFYRRGVRYVRIREPNKNERAIRVLIEGPEGWIEAQKTGVPPTSRSARFDVRDSEGIGRVVLALRDRLGWTAKKRATPRPGRVEQTAPPDERAGAALYRDRVIQACLDACPGAATYERTVYTALLVSRGSRKYFAYLWHSGPEEDVFRLVAFAPEEGAVKLPGVRLLRGRPTLDLKPGDDTWVAVVLARMAFEHAGGGGNAR